MRFIRDDFPAPFGPSRPNTCPFEIFRQRLSNIKWFFLNESDIFSNEINGLGFLNLVILLYTSRFRILLLLIKKIKKFYHKQNISTA